MSQSRPTDHEADAYAQSYVLYGDQSRAFRAAFPRSTAKPKSIHERASKFHLITKVQSRLAELAPKLAEVAEERFKIDAEYVMRRIVEIDQMDVSDIFNDDGSIKLISDWPKVWRQYVSGLDVAEMFEGRGGQREMVGFLKKIKWPDKVKNLEMMGRLTAVGAFKDHIEHSGKIGMVIASDEDQL